MFDSCYPQFNESLGEKSPRLFSLAEGNDGISVRDGVDNNMHCGGRNMCYNEKRQYYYERKV